ncbi:hypothetical protein [Desulfovibrio sp.]|uniref:hypothetical protein n=1 Tax=Desulfovibrio sp. TaxID=885 RepID=UPI0025C1E5C6|nr:hypothetical protein [Desulfovibrio sp.]
MLDPQKICMVRVKQGFGLNEHEAQSLLHALSPECVFPYEVWQNAYSSYWQRPAAEIARLYKVENPSFPEIPSQSIQYCPTDVYAKWIVDFFFELARRISARELEDGFDYIVESTFDNKSAVSESEREYLFYPLRLADKNIANVARIEGLKEVNVKLSSPDSLAKIFPDTVAVDKTAAIYYLAVVLKYPLVQEVKGITQSLVDSVIKAAAQGTLRLPKSILALGESAAEIHPQGQKTLSLPRSLWDGKTQEYICAALREKGWGTLQIAHVLFHKRGFTQKRAIAKLLHENPNLSDSAYDKYGKTLFEDSKSIVISDEDDLQ